MTLFAIFIDVLCGLVPLMVLSVLSYFTERNKKSIICRAGMILFCVSLLAVFSATGIPNVYDFHVETDINIVPLEYLGSGSYGQYILNILLFAPVGFLLPALWASFSKIYKTALFGFGLSLFVELLQLLNFRATDIDDLIMNTLGAVFGFVLFRVLEKLIPKISVIKTNGRKAEPFLFGIVTCVIMIFIQPVISKRVWDIMYVNLN